MMTQHSLSTSHQIAGEKIVDFLNQFMKNKIKFKELTESTRKKLENVLHTNIILAVEEINWLDIIEVLKLLHSEEGDAFLN
jgi:methyltransferase-like protein